MEKFAAYKDARDLIYFDRDLKPMVDKTLEEVEKKYSNLKIANVEPVKKKNRRVDANKIYTKDNPRRSTRNRKNTELPELKF